VSRARSCYLLERHIADTYLPSFTSAASLASLPSSPTTANPTLLAAEPCFSSAATLALPSSFPSSLPPLSFYSHIPPSHHWNRLLHHRHRLDLLPLPPRDLPRGYDAQNAHTGRCFLDAMPSSPKWDPHHTTLLCVSRLSFHFFPKCPLS
jgi:hypothetical protein